MDTPFKIATCSPIETEESELLSAMTEMSGAPAGQHQVHGLAGPNELLQIIGEPQAWEVWIKAATAIFGTAFLAKLGSRSADGLADQISKLTGAIKNGAAKQFNSVHEAFRSARAKQFATLVSIPIDSQGTSHAALNITTDDLFTMVNQVSVFASLAPTIQTILSGRHLVAGKNRMDIGVVKKPDCRSIAIEIDESYMVTIPSYYKPAAIGSNKSRAIPVSVQIS